MGHPTNSLDEELNEVNVIPMADVTLVLLIILMVISPMISQALIQVQSAQATDVHTREEIQDVPETPVIISFEPGSLKLNGTVMGSDIEFTSRLRDVMSKRKDKSVLLTASPAVTHGKVVWIMDLIKRNSVQTLTLVKWKDEEEPS
jgi:biopolymer transport protein ExbD